MKFFRHAACALSLWACAAQAAATPLDQTPLHDFGTLMAGPSGVSFQQAEGVSEAAYAERLTFSLAEAGRVTVRASWYSSFRLFVYPSSLQLFDAQGQLMGEGEHGFSGLPSCASPQHPGSSECWSWVWDELSTSLAAGDYSIVFGGTLNDAHEYPRIDYGVSVAIPEPSGAALMLLGCAGLWLGRRARSRPAR